MNHRFTMKELENWSDRRVLEMLITERVSTLCALTPLARRLLTLRNKLASGKPLTKR